MTLSLLSIVNVLSTSVCVRHRSTFLAPINKQHCGSRHPFFTTGYFVFTLYLTQWMHQFLLWWSSRAEAAPPQPLSHVLGHMPQGRPSISPQQC